MLSTDADLLVAKPVLLLQCCSPAITRHKCTRFSSIMLRCLQLNMCASTKVCCGVQEKELEECTFSPKITTMPSYIPRSEHGLYSSMTSRSNTKYAERAAQRTVEWV